MGRAPCCSKVGLNRGPWTPEEDMLLSKYIEAHGEGNWRALPKSAGLLRCGKSCRLRWVNYLRPNVKRGNISEDEEDLIIMLHALLGNRWSLIAARMPGRTDNEIKNYWNTHLSKKLASRGLDPKTHKPIISSSSTSSSGGKANKSEDSTEEAPQQSAWETTMDLDTSSYSTGSCDHDDDQHHGHDLSRQHSRSQKKHKKQQQGCPAVVEHKKLVLSSVSVPDQCQKDSANKFDCPSPSSVLNIQSPTNSGSNSTSSSDHSNTTDNSSFCSTIHMESDQSGAAQTPEELINIHAAESHVQMLEFIDEFLSKDHQPADIFKEDGGSEFWDSLGKIDLPECSPVCQSDLWDGLTDLVPNQAPVPASSPPPSLLHSIQILPSHSPCASHFLQDNISELLFCS